MMQFFEKRLLWSLISILTIAAAGPVSADDPMPKPGEPLWVGDELIYPEGANIPRGLTDVERKYLESHPPVGSRSVTPPPSGPIHCIAEYEPTEGLLMSWEAFNSSSADILPTMVKHITTTANSKVFMVVDTAAEQSAASSMISAAGANMSKVQFIICATDSVWIRDYGPRYIYEGNCRAVIDHQYNRPRPLDDAFPSYFANTIKHHAYYELGTGSYQLIHGGGNYHLDAFNHSFATELVWNENPSLSHTQIHDIWQLYQGVDTHIFPPFPTSVDSTQHLDMWMQVIADDKVVISDWPNNAGSTQDIICDNAAIYMAGKGYTVYRVPARSISSVHYTYTNVAMINNAVLVPTYTNSTIVAAGHNGQALATWQAALPGKTIVQVNCQGMVQYAGIMHCIVMHVPVNKGGVNPDIYLKNYRGGDTLTPGSNIEINWISDDDVSVSNVDILLSTNGGASYDTTIAAGTADDGSFIWNVPSICSQQARIKVVAHDGSGNTGFDASTSNLTITAPFPTGDVTCDCNIDLLDVDPFVTALVDPPNFTGCDINQADVNGDLSIDGGDVRDFVDAVLP